MKPLFKPLKRRFYERKSIGEQAKVLEERATQRYEHLEQEAEMILVRPNEWNYGVAAKPLYSVMGDAA